MEAGFELVFGLEVWVSAAPPFDDSAKQWLYMGIE